MAGIPAGSGADVKPVVGPLNQLTVIMHAQPAPLPQRKGVIALDPKDVAVFLLDITRRLPAVPKDRIDLQFGEQEKHQPVLIGVKRLELDLGLGGELQFVALQGAVHPVAVDGEIQVVLPGKVGAGGIFCLSMKLVDHLPEMIKEGPLRRRLKRTSSSEWGLTSKKSGSRWSLLKWL